jgi:hypothetical protein
MKPAIYAGFLTHPPAAPREVSRKARGSWSAAAATAEQACGGVADGLVPSLPWLRRAASAHGDRARAETGRAASRDPAARLVTIAAPPAM